MLKGLTIGCFDRFIHAIAEILIIFILASEVDWPCPLVDNRIVITWTFACKSVPISVKKDAIATSPEYRVVNKHWN